jgi:2-hydroxy-4-carboxymuconate semialdehyde hemiacetal dehydrogenase
MNVCMVGHGMMGQAHTLALHAAACTLHTLVGRRAGATRAFAEAHGYRHWVTSLDEALADPAIDAVVIANPSEQHAAAAAAALRAGKHALVEIPLAMSYAGAEALVQDAAARGLVLGVVHPLRLQPTLVALRGRVQAGTEQIRHVGGRFFLRRLEDVGATGYRRSWRDNLLWHHVAHVCDLGVWLVDTPLRSVVGVMPPPDPQTGTPLAVAILAETEQAQSLVFTGSYEGQETLADLWVVTDQTSYRWDIEHSRFALGGDLQVVAHENVYNAQIAVDFVEAAAGGRPPLVPGESVLPGLAVLQQVQDQWDARYGAQAIPGRSLPG